MGRIFKKIICVFLILAGLALFFYPDVLTAEVESNAKKTITVFEETYPGSDGDGGQDEESAGMEDLLATVEEYNARIYEEGQSGFKDAWSYEQAPIELKGLEGEVFGYIEIPDMDISLPLYLGASSANMLKGAAILGETSLPIGGENTNSVIAAHRGYSGIPFFRDIENLQPGDKVYITNPWEKLAYRVESISIIDPDDTDAVKIQEGRDMITLLTCHPYRSSGPYRYLVYCVRDTLDEGTEEENEKVITEHTVEIPDSSQEDIFLEQLIRRICGGVILCIAVITIVVSAIRKIREKRNKPTYMRRHRRKR